MLPYTLRQLVWMLTSALQLIYALSTGIVWVLQMLRLFAYGACVGICFIPHWWWYLTSPNIIRRVSYRSSDTTKRRNILRVLEAEGVDLHEVLRKSETPPALPAGLRRRRVLAANVRSRSRIAGGAEADELPFMHNNYNSSNGGGSGGRRRVLAGPPPPPHLRRRRPLSDAATVAAGASSDSAWAYDAASDEFGAPLTDRRTPSPQISPFQHAPPQLLTLQGRASGNGDGEVAEVARVRSPPPHRHGSAVSYPNGGRLRPLRRRLVREPQPDFTGSDPAGKRGEEDERWAAQGIVRSPSRAYSPQQRQQQHGLVLSDYYGPPAPHGARAASSTKGGPARRRLPATARSMGDALGPTTATPSTALERLMGAATVLLNPADGSALRSLPVTPQQQKQQRQPRASPRRESNGKGATAANATAHMAIARVSGRGSDDGRPQRPSRSPTRHSPRPRGPFDGSGKLFSMDTLEAAPGVNTKQSSSSSCDMTVNRPECSSGEEDRGVGKGTTPQLRSTVAPSIDSTADAPPPPSQQQTEERPPSAHEVPIYEGRPVYYDTLPKAELPNDPLLKDVLAALQEGEDARGCDAFHQDDVADYEERGDAAALPRDGSSRRQRRHPNEEGSTPPRGVAVKGHGRACDDDDHHYNNEGDRDEGDGTRVSETGSNSRLRPARRSPQRRTPARTSPSPPSHAPELPIPQHTRTFSEENILAGLDEEDEEDRMNLHNRATVDIVLPVPLDSLMKTLEYTQHSKRLRRKRFPIVIDVTGAVWIIGSHLWSTMMARVLAQRGYVVFCPDYRNFPQTTMEGMTLDVSDAVAWVLNNAERYNGDLSNVTLIGQSAGAHLSMMSLLSQAQLSAYRSNTMRGMYENVPPPSDVAYNVPRYNPRESIHRYVGLSGMYNIEGLVDHFQKEGLNTPVLHQIAGGRDQLARYSIHAYFDDRRNGDTGEVLPDNIFDYFPQRMFFVHGDADKCAPVTESASLVAMLRRAQARFAVRRSERNAEARRHALRSRRLLPGALAGAAAAAAATSFGSASMHAHENTNSNHPDDYDHGESAEGDFMNHHNGAGVDAQYTTGHHRGGYGLRSAGEEDGQRGGGGSATSYYHYTQPSLRGEVELDATAAARGGFDVGEREDEFEDHRQHHPRYSHLPHGEDREGANEAYTRGVAGVDEISYDYAVHAAPPPAAVFAGQSILMHDGGGNRRTAFYAADDANLYTPSSRQPQPQQPQPSLSGLAEVQTPPPTIVSPIVPPSRQDQPQPSVELEFIVIPHGRHSDAFVDECIAAGRSCCVDFLCDYESAVDYPTSSFSNSMHNGGEGDSLGGSLRDPSYPAGQRGGGRSSSSNGGGGGERVPAWMAQSAEVCAMPDGILPLAVPTEERSLPLRLCTLICPF